jgi:hypothetical protein
MARRAATTQSWFMRMIMAILRFFGRMLGLYRPSPSEPSSPDSTEQPNKAQTEEEKHLRFRRAILMLDLAVAHARHEFPDSAHTLLSRAWDDLESNLAARIQWHATTALVYAIGNNTNHATKYLRYALDEYENSYHSLSTTVRRRIYRLCISTMECLPHNRQIEQLVSNARTAHKQGDFVTALRLLDQADTLYTQYSRLVSPSTDSRRLNTWYTVLEDMNNRGGSSTRTILDAFRLQQTAPASPLVGAVA